MRKRLPSVLFVSVFTLTILIGAGMPFDGGHVDAAPSDTRGADEDMEYQCVIVVSPSEADQSTTLPNGMASVAVGDSFYVEFWATDSGSTNTGIVSAYADLDYAEGCVSTATELITHTALFNLFTSGSDTGLIVDELGGS